MLLGHYRRKYITGGGNLGLLCISRFAWRSGSDFSAFRIPDWFDLGSPELYYDIDHSVAYLEFIMSVFM